MNKSLQSLFLEIQCLVSCPHKIYTKLYLSTLSQFITLCPTNDAVYQLKLAIISLKLRRGIFLPKNATAETIAAEEAQWTYALFSSALLSGLQPSTIKKIIPDIAISWLNINTFLSIQWKAALEDKITEKNELSDIIMRAHELIAK